MKLILFSIVFVLFLGKAHAQLVTGTGASPLNLVQNVLLGPGVTVSNIMYNGAPSAIGSFQASGTNLGIEDGILLTTGTVLANSYGPQGPNNQGGSGADNGYGGSGLLSNILNGEPTFNAAILEFDFVPYSDTVAFKYVFGSEEYPEYAPPISSTYNDVFGFFISGPGILGYQNIAQLPNGNGVVSINNVNPVTNAQYYIYNGEGNNAPWNGSDQYIQYDGFTKVLKAVSEVQCGQTYHLVIAIADVGDGSWDSGIFLEANSLSSPTPVEITYTVSSELFSNPNWIAEGCVTATVTLERETNLDESLTVPLVISGSATNGVDYTGIPNTITFNPGETQVSFTISVVLDGIEEGLENILLDFPLEDPCGNITPVSIELFLQDIEAVNVEISNTEIGCPGENITLNTNVTGGLEPYTYLWNTGETSSSISISPTETGTYFVEVVDDCLNVLAYDTVIVSVPEYEPISIVTSDDIIEICPNVGQSIFVEATGGTGNYIYTWTNAMNQIISSADSSFISPMVSTYFVVEVDDECGSYAFDTIFYEVTSPPLELIISPSVSLCPGDSTLVQISASGGFGSYSYFWPHSQETSTQVWVQPFSTTNYQVQVSDDCQTFFVTASIQVIVVKPDANFTVISDPIVENLPISFQNLTSNGFSYEWYFGDGGYSSEIHPNHVYDEPGTYPITLVAEDSKGCIDSITLYVEILNEYFVYLPNTFIPDGDRVNEVFSASLIGVQSIEIEIFNRWGQLIFSSTDLDFEWDGTYKGRRVQNGTYLWKLRVLPLDKVDKELFTGHVNILK
ncbi:MAG: choice-of-anchor L domain-containing protein [Crocinitomicaceae bacterium]|nr:choice-of-anchor L domain-containing protein [Crocinitomicaceae bacterium]